MPVILDREQDYETWLAPLIPAPKRAPGDLPGKMEIYPVSSLVNSPKYDPPGLIQRSTVK